MPSPCIILRVVSPHLRLPSRNRRPCLRKFQYRSIRSCPLLDRRQRASIGHYAEMIGSLLYHRLANAMTLKSRASVNSHEPARLRLLTYLPFRVSLYTSLDLRPYTSSRDWLRVAS